MAAYYSEIDPYAAQWLRNLIAAGEIAPGDVDERSITEAKPDDLRGYTQCHFFAGIGGWSLAARLAGWPDERPIWTGSCPCQPFSAAGKRKGTTDERHLWPEFRRLIAECRPAVVFGEQVASKDGRDWLAGIRTDLEALAYAVGAADLCAAGIGAPHIRQRLWWVADALRDGAEHRPAGCDQPEGSAIGAAGSEVPRPSIEPRRGGSSGRPANPHGERRDRQHALLRAEEAGREPSALHEAARRSTDGRLGDADGPGSQGRRDGSGEGQRPDQWVAWSAGEFIGCSDGKARRVEPGIFPLAYGISGKMVVVRPSQQAGAAPKETEEHHYSRIGALRAFGNAIVPQVAAEFIGAWLEARP